MFDRPEIRTPIAIALGAIAGALSRYYVGVWLSQRLGADLPYGTLLINLTGCAAMGFFATFALEHVTPIAPELRLLVAVGFLGSYTTFSTYALDSIALLRDRGTFVSLMYWAGSAVFGAISLSLGISLAKWLDSP